MLGALHLFLQLEQRVWGESDTVDGGGAERMTHYSQLFDAQPELRQPQNWQWNLRLEGGEGGIGKQLSQEIGTVCIVKVLFTPDQ